MEERVISPKYLFYSAVFGHMAILIIASLMFKIVSEGRQIGPMVVFGIIFILTTLLTLFHINRQVYLRVIGGAMINYGTLFKDAVVPLKSVRNVKRIWFNTYKIKIDGKNYILYGFKNDVLYFKDLVQRTEERFHSP